MVFTKQLNRKVNYFVEAKKAKVLKVQRLQSSPTKKLNIGSFVKRFAWETFEAASGLSSSWSIKSILLTGARTSRWLKRWLVYNVFVWRMQSVCHISHLINSKHNRFCLRDLFLRFYMIDVLTADVVTLNCSTDNWLTTCPKSWKGFLSNSSGWIISWQMVSGAQFVTSGQLLCSTFCQGTGAPLVNARVFTQIRAYCTARIHKHSKYAHYTAGRLGVCLSGTISV